MGPWRPFLPGPPPPVEDFDVVQVDALRPIGPLQPGAYVVECDRDLSESQLRRLHEMLNEQAPEGVSFLLLANGLHLVPTSVIEDTVA